MERDRIKDILKEEREKKNIKIDEIVEKTRIPLKYVELLEKGQWDKFPSKVHLLGYMKIYCEYIGFDENRIEEILSEFKNEEDEENEEEIENNNKDGKEKVLVIILPLIFFTIYFFTFYLLSGIE
ncbi:helix-turn-helix domain-containing protein [bacterium]|nr:helix-turn-helix domain-containing protein [bacterium]